jgi:hypothetical protein
MDTPTIVTIATSAAVLELGLATALGRRLRRRDSDPLDEWLRSLRRR